MARNRAFQPTTKNVADLAIGLSKVSIGTSTDTNVASGVTGGLTTLGALKNASISMKPTIKEHKSGYPAQVDFKIGEVLKATYKADIEEPGLAVNLAFIDDSIDSLETGTPIFRSIEALSEFGTGGTLSLFSPHAQVKPNLTMNFGNDFNSIPFEFEALSDQAFTNKDLVYRKKVLAAARSIVNQPITQNPANLDIGMFQVRVGKPSMRASGLASITPAQLRLQGSPVATTIPVATASGTYTGAHDGAIILKCTAAADGAIVLEPTLPDGTLGTPITMAVAGTPVVIGTTGVSIAFDSVAASHFSDEGNTDAHTVAYGDVYVIGCYTANALNQANTGIVSPYSFLTSADSVGSVKNSSLTTASTFKEHRSGYPEILDLLVLETSTITIGAGLEEINAATTSLVTGQAGTIFDILFDASVNGQLYFMPVEVVTELATGGLLSFWCPNCQIVPEADFAPGADWADMAFKLEAYIQQALGTKRIYRQKIITK